MAMFAEKLRSFEDLYWHEIEDLYDAEKQLTEALPKMADAAHAEELKNAFREHLRVTEQQKRRLEEIFSTHGRKSNNTTCKAMKGLVAEGDEMIKAKGDPAVKDAALIAAAQRVEHYEISGYGSARAFARHLGYQKDATLLQTTLDEESNTDQKLNHLAESRINPRVPREGV